MQIQSGKLYENKTWKYLYPCLKHYGPELYQHLSGFFKIAVGVKDKNNPIKENEINIYILFDTNIIMINDRDISAYKAKFNTFLNWIKYQPFYTDDYIYEGNLHMVVIKLPNKHKETYKKFVQGLYSEMYTEVERNEYFRFLNLTNKEKEKEMNDKISHTRGVLSKSSNLLLPFVSRINNEFNTHLSVEELKHIELDFPPKLQEEIFNY